MQFLHFLEHLKQLLDTPLCGRVSHLKLAPDYRKSDLLNANKRDNARQAAVLLLFYPDLTGETRLVLTKRASYPGHHADQISFPGGKKELKDASLKQTALRETLEEIGITIPENNVIRKLTKLYIPPSNFLVAPYIGYTNTTPKFRVNHEVCKIISPKLSDLLHDTIISQKPITSNTGQSHIIPYFLIEGEMVWGATAMILSELLDLFNNSTD